MDQTSNIAGADERPVLTFLRDDWERSALLIVLALAFAIRLYLSLTSYCISGDGVGYLGMAREFSSGQWHKALSAVFSPLYPLLIAAAHRTVPDWELAGDLVSTVLGTAAVLTTFLMMRQVFRRDIAFGAAILVAIHPELAAYSASVRTEAGYIFMITASSWFILRSLNRQHLLSAAMAGIVGGLGYLYRTEGIGLMPLGSLLFIAAGFLWKQTSRRSALAAAGAFSICFSLVAAPYIGYLRFSTGHWSIGREFTAAMMYGMGDVAGNGSHWRELGYSSNASPLIAVLAYPRLYLVKVGEYLATSTYNFVQGLEPLLTAFLAIGLWVRGRKILATAGETFFAAVVLFYFLGFSLSYTGTRFMVHLIPFTFGWVIVGIIAFSLRISQFVEPNWVRFTYFAVPIAIAVILLPRTLWPIGFDMRGVRYAGEDIAKLASSPSVVAARDGRVAYYAGARFVELPSVRVDNLCAWLGSQDPDFLLLGNRDERNFAISSNTACLDFIRRYPRYGNGYYDLYAVRQHRSGDIPGKLAGIRPRS